MKYYQLEPPVLLFETEPLTLLAITEAAGIPSYDFAISKGFKVTGEHGSQEFDQAIIEAGKPFFENILSWIEMNNATVSLDARSVWPGGCDRTPDWHRDGRTGVIVSIALPTEFAVGRLNSSHPLVQELFQKDRSALDSLTERA